MKLQQLRYVSAVIRNNLNISAAAERLYTSQPGISRQIRLLEEELGVDIFERSGRQLSRLTPAGQAIAAQLERVLVEVEAMGRVAGEFSDPDRGSLRVAASQTEACYLLPSLVRSFKAAFPRVSVQLQQAGPQQMTGLIEEGEVDFAVSAEPLEAGDEVVEIPCFQWNFGVVVPAGHPLTEAPLTLEALAAHPLLTYIPGSKGRTSLDRAFSARALALRPVLTASDADVIKTFVRQGMGAGIIAAPVHDPSRDADLTLLPAAHLFTPGITGIAFRKGLYLQRFHYELLRLLAPHLSRGLVDSAARASSAAARARLFQDIGLESYDAVPGAARGPSHASPV